MNPNDYAVLIITHKRPRKQKTRSLFRRLGYTGCIYLVVDDKDDTLEEYKRLYKDEVVVFSKSDYPCDTCDNFGVEKSTVYVRNACYDIARSRGYRYFIMVDDDLDNLIWRYNGERNIKRARIKNLDAVFLAFMEFFSRTPFYSFGFGSAADYRKKKKLDVKFIPNFFQLAFLDAEKRIVFRASASTDMSALYGCYTGKLTMTYPGIEVKTPFRGSNAGGLKEAYDTVLDAYVRDFYQVIMYPACYDMETRYFDRFVPTIIEERFKK